MLYDTLQNAGIASAKLQALGYAMYHEAYAKLVPIEFCYILYSTCQGVLILKYSLQRLRPYSVPTVPGTL